MPKVTHEAIGQLFRNAPNIIDALLPRPAGVAAGGLPATSVHISQAEFVDLNLAEYRADNVLLYGEDPRKPVHVRVVEIQLRSQVIKPFRWLLYTAGLRVRYQCPVDLTVITVDREVAAWAARTIKAGLSDGALSLTPDVIGPDQIPVVTDAAWARQNPEMAVLSLIAHGDQPGAEHIAVAAVEAVKDLDSDRAAVYLDVVFANLGEVARAALEALMHTGNYEFQSDIARSWFSKGKAEGEAKGEAKGKAEGEAKGKAEGEARVLLQLMTLRGLEVTEAIRERVMGTTDCTQLEAWVSRVLDAKTAAEVLDG